VVSFREKYAATQREALLLRAEALASKAGEKEVFEKEKGKILAKRHGTRQPNCYLRPYLSTEAVAFAG
jgi:hypothetical protein